MIEMDELHPEYGFKDHKGYATKKHLENIKRYGINNEYRFTFKPICDLIISTKGEVKSNEKTIKK